MFVFRNLKMIFFFCILFFVNIMKQNLYDFLQTCMDLNLSFIFLQNFSLFKNKYIYISFFFWLLYPFFFFLTLSKLDFKKKKIKFTLMLIHISYHLILYPRTKKKKKKKKKKKTNNNNY